MTKSIIVQHPGRHEASEEQKAEAGVTEGYRLYKSQSGVESVFLPEDAAPPASVPHADLTVAELRDYAAEKGVDLGDATKKADILAALQDAGL